MEDGRLYRGSEIHLRWLKRTIRRLVLETKHSSPNCGIIENTLIHNIRMRQAIGRIAEKFYSLRWDTKKQLLEYNSCSNLNNSKNYWGSKKKWPCMTITLRPPIPPGTTTWGSDGFRPDTEESTKCDSDNRTLARNTIQKEVNHHGRICRESL